MLQNITWFHVAFLVVLVLFGYRIIRAMWRRAIRSESGDLREHEQIDKEHD